MRHNTCRSSVEQPHAGQVVKQLMLRLAVLAARSAVSLQDTHVATRWCAHVPSQPSCPPSHSCISSAGLGILPASEVASAQQGDLLPPLRAHLKLAATGRRNALRRGRVCGACQKPRQHIPPQNLHVTLSVLGT